MKTKIWLITAAALIVDHRWGHGERLAVFVQWDQLQPHQASVQRQCTAQCDAIPRGSRDPQRSKRSLRQLRGVIFSDGQWCAADA